eukprot:6211190-Pleurochrysis_carterae.AAC.1
MAPEFRGIGIASGKENFGRCTTCGNLEEAIRKARYSQDAQLLLRKKQERFDHIKRERADKPAYYAHREAARAKGASSLSCIIDKMDGNKNRCPRYALRHTHTRYGFKYSINCQFYNARDNDRHRFLPHALSPFGALSSYSHLPNHLPLCRPSASLAVRRPPTKS